MGTMGLEEVIATRELQMRHPDRTVLIEIGRPRLRLDGEDWFCPYRITGFGRGDIRYASGVDSLQALMLAIDMVGARIHTSRVFKEGRLFWSRPNDPDLGLPHADLAGPPTGPPANDEPVGEP